MMAAQHTSTDTSEQARVQGGQQHAHNLLACQQCSVQVSASASKPCYCFGAAVAAGASATVAAAAADDVLSIH
jgi:hypothetical protein